MDKPVLHLIAGANGSGKSTLAKALLAGSPLPFLNAGEAALELNGEVSQVKVQAGKIVLRKLEQLLAQRVSFIIETTLSGRVHQKIIKQARSLGYYVKLTYIYLDSVRDCIARVAVRILSSGHAVPDEDIIRRYPRSINNFWTVYRQMVDEWVLLYNSSDTLIAVARQVNQELTVIDQRLYATFTRLSK